MRNHWPSRRLRGFVSFAVGAALVFSLATPSAPLAATHRVRADDAAATVIATYRERIPDLMAEQGIPGLAVALVNEDQTLWVEGFGHVDGPDSARVNADTIFSVQSMSKQRSTFDRIAIRSTVNRAVGHVHLFREPPLDVPMTAAGGLYTSAADLARFLHFELNGGSIDGRVVLDRKWLDEMQAVPPPRAGAPAGYALGVARHRWNGWPDLVEHGGGGFGFLSDLWWLPQPRVGIAILTNSDDHQLQDELALSILADLLGEPGVYHDRLLALPWRLPADDPDGLFEPPAGMAKLVADAAMVATGDEATRWAGYSGSYRAPVWGFLDPSGAPDRFCGRRGRPLLRGRRP